jgi:hypothetical protein
MATFAKIGINSTVLSVTPLDDELCYNADNVADEAVGQQYLENVHGWPADLWVQCSFNTQKGVHYTQTKDENGTVTSITPSADQTKAFRGNYPSKGDIWDAENNIFYKPRPHASWTLNKSTATWESPNGLPTTIFDDGIRIEYKWNEVNTRWQTTDNTKYWNADTSTWDTI